MASSLSPSSLVPVAVPCSQPAETIDPSLPNTLVQVRPIVSGSSYQDKSAPASAVPGSLHPLARHELIDQASNQPKITDRDALQRPRFVRTDQWKPVYSWLESLETTEVVKSKDISEWLSVHPRVKEQLDARHSRYHLMHYIQKMHLKMLKKREKLKGNQAARVPVASIPSKGVNGPKAEPPLSRNISNTISNDDEIFSLKKSEALLRFELYTDLQNQLINVLWKQKKRDGLQESNIPVTARRSMDDATCQNAAVASKVADLDNDSEGNKPSPVSSSESNKRRKCGESSPTIQTESVAVCNLSSSVIDSQPSSD